MTITRLDTTLRSGEVTRYHAVPEVRPQTDGLHAWGVMVILVYITGGKLSQDLLLEAMMHDTGELTTGDLPFTVKRDYPDIASAYKLIEYHARANTTILAPIGLSARDAALLKVADTLEGYIWCARYENQSSISDKSLGQWPRWEMALRRCMEVFADNLLDAEWVRVREIQNHYGRTIR